jgi:uncharacterized protein (TIGR02391 family)
LTTEVSAQMPSRKRPDIAPVDIKTFNSANEIDSAIQKLKRRIEELEQLDVRAAVLGQTGADSIVQSNVRATIRDVFGASSPEFKEHAYLKIWAGGEYVNMADYAIVDAKEKGKRQVRGVLEGLIGRLEEKCADLDIQNVTKPTNYFAALNLHPRIADVSNDLFLDGYHWEAVFAASKALVNYVKERSGRHDLDGALLMRTVFSRNAPVLAFNDLSDQTQTDEQEGMMHLFEGVVLAIRNPGGHSFPEGSEQRAIEYISLLSLLAYRVQESVRRKSSQNSVT